MSERATIVRAVKRDWLGRGYRADVVSGTSHSYHPSTTDERRGWTAMGARRAGDRLIRRIESADRKREARRARAAKATEQAKGNDRG